MSDDLDFPHLHPETYGYTDREQPFHDILDVLGPMSHVQPVPEEEIEEYQGRLPDGLLQFWRENGRGALLNGYGWICDPKEFKGVLEAVFEGDPEYRADEFIPYFYGFDGRIDAWSPRCSTTVIDLTGFQPRVDPYGEAPHLESDGTIKTPDFAVGHTLRRIGLRLLHDRADDFDQFTEASRKLGQLQPGEIFGFFPPRQMEGEGYVEDMRRVQAVEHLLLHTQLGRPTLTRYIVDPDDLAYPMGRIEAVRPLGPQEQPPNGGTGP